MKEKGPARVPTLRATELNVTLPRMLSGLASTSSRNEASAGKKRVKICMMASG